MTLSRVPARRAISISRSAVAAVPSPSAMTSCDGVAGDEVGQAVGADQVAVAGTGLAHGQVGLVAVVAGEDPGDQGPLRVVLGLLRA